ncbi:tRNA glutamyl-Q(34) synthetase GluQRS [Sphingomonas jeddahensis]|uniref:tRNA glutamyl-Q(34) synthetase GluQRS n=1 Tax=Sphingomonas jeddahensis TaxID=1915074 RepID=UPI0009F81A57
MTRSEIESPPLPTTPAPRTSARVTVTRFAPSPTGRLHLGHAYSAILAHDFARARDGKFLLRIEDIDGTRSRPEHIETIRDDLAWLGLAWDSAVIHQSQRLPAYAAALDQLRGMGLLYRCYCTRAEIAAASLSAPHGAEPLYPGTCRGRSDEPDRLYCWRLDMAAAVARAGALTWQDHGRAIPADPLATGDVVLARKDAPASYHLAVTIDDAWQSVTDVVRGRDLFAATHVHRLLQALLGLPTPHYHHHYLLTGPDGVRLAKRHNAPTLAALREAGVEGRKIAAELRAGRLPNHPAST